MSSIYNNNNNFTQNVRCSFFEPSIYRNLVCLQCTVPRENEREARCDCQINLKPSWTMLNSSSIIIHREFIMFSFARSYIQTTLRLTESSFGQQCSWNCLFPLLSLFGRTSLSLSHSLICLCQFQYRSKSSRIRLNVVKVAYSNLNHSDRWQSNDNVDFVELFVFFFLKRSFTHAYFNCNYYSLL